MAWQHLHTFVSADVFELGDVEPAGTLDLLGLQLQRRGEGDGKYIGLDP